jgi:hypothetical protein
VFEPRARILVTSLVALGVSLAVSLAVVGAQKASGRADLTARATAFVRVLKGDSSEGGADVGDFLRPEDRASPAVLVGLRRLAGAYRSDRSEIEFSQVEILGPGKARTIRSVGPPGQPMFREREIDWVRGGDGRWYLDPAGL